MQILTRNSADLELATIPNLELDGDLVADVLGKKPRRLFLPPSAAERTEPIYRLRYEKELTIQGSHWTDRGD